MFWNKKPSVKKKVSHLDSLIGQHTRLVGNITFSGGLHVDGAIEGNVTADDEENAVLTISDRGSIKGDVRVPYVVINGALIGDVYARKHIELASSARVEGNVYYQLVEMAVGAELNGQLVRSANGERPPLALRHVTSDTPASGA